ncbi:uncharacterized protein [Halyomorpha halys]|uniref:uncharacterized protein isoform X2 n=1 Tax=Halyomorpha halys TaxID=286706 RepID=UPI0006D500DE|nr:uncharacterized protein LOC106680242 isoform X3 [Halyomorpha halys]
MKVLLLVLLAGAVVARPEVGTDRKAEEQKDVQQLESAPIPRCSKTDAGCPRTLEYYGGARGQYLLVYPDGRMFITGKRRAPGDDEDVGTAPDDPSDSVSIFQPPPNASVAEAKPVSVAIAGEGGVASAAPVAQAIVGPQGLAISRPVATAVAGVPGQEELIASILGQGKTHGYAYSIFHPNAIQPNTVPVLYYPIVY